MHKNFLKNLNPKVRLKRFKAVKAINKSIINKAAFVNENKKYNICSRCIMDTTDPEITFNKDNICNHCEYFDE